MGRAPVHQGCGGHDRAVYTRVYLKEYGVFRYVKAGTVCTACNRFEAVPDGLMLGARMEHKARVREALPLS